MKNEDICCCCLVNCCTIDINQVYNHNGKVECYGAMLSNTFNVSLRRKSICERYIVKLRDAAEFKQQIILADQTLISVTQQLPDDNDDQEICEAELQPKEKTNEILPHEDRLEDDGSMDTADDEARSEKNNATIEVKKKPNVIEKCKQICEAELQPKEKTNEILPHEDRLEDDGSMDTADDEARSEKNNATIEVKKKPNVTEKCKQKPRRVLKGPTKNTVHLISNSNLCIFKPHQNNTEYACYLCKETCTNIKELREHSKTHKLSEFLTRISALQGMTCRHVDISNLSCICAHACEDLDSLTKHLTETHKIQFQNGGHLLIPYKLENGYRCVVCKKDFNTFYSLTTHMNCHSTHNVCDICGSAYFSRQYLRQHVKAKHKESTCRICLCKFPTAAKLAQHTRKIHKKIQTREYPCNLCNLIFNYGYKLKNHMVAFHGMPEIKVDCDICGKVLKNELCLRTHKRSVHDKERRFQCTLCDLRFFTKFDRVRHEKTHLDTSLFSCDCCETKFKSKDSLRRHIKKQHSVSI